MPYNSLDRQPYLEDLLKASAIPFTGITVTDINAEPPVVTINYSELATAQQIIDGNAILADFDWRARRALPTATVRATLLNALTQSDRTNLVVAILAQFLLGDPRQAAKLISLVGLSGVAVDEVDPT